MTKRTIRDFAVTGDPWSLITAWAGENGYRVVKEEGQRKTWQHGIGWWMAPMMLSIAQTSTGLHLEAWVRFPMFVRMSTFFLVPAEMGIESGGFRGRLPRDTARKKVNRLLAIFGQEGIP